MIFIAEPVHFGATHLQINSAIVALTVSSFPNESVCFIAENDHALSVGNRLKNSGIHPPELQVYKNYNPRHKFSWFKKILGEVIVVGRVLMKARKKKPQLLVWTCLFPTGHLAMLLLKSIICPQQKQLVVLHGELEYLKEINQKKSERFLAYLMQQSFAKRNKHTFYLVLSKAIAQKFQAKFPKLEQRLLLQAHPFLYQQFNRDLQQKEVLKICLFGAQVNNRVAAIKTLVGLLEQEISSGAIAFTLIGVQNQAVWSDWPQLHIVHQDDFMPQEELESHLAKNDIAVFLYDADSYQYTASGAIHEALNAGLPIYALHNSYFDELFYTFNLGVLKNSIHEIADAILRLQHHQEQLMTTYYQEIIMYLQQNSFLLQTQNWKNNLNRIADTIQ